MIEPAAGCAVLTFDGEITPFTRVLRGERSPAAARYRACKLAMGLTWKAQWAGKPLLGKGLWVDLDILVTVPVARLLGMDSSNLGKGIEDSLIGVVLADDRYVRRFEVTKQPARPVVGVLPGCRVELAWEVKDGGVDGDRRD